MTLLILVYLYLFLIVGNTVAIINDRQKHSNLFKWNYIFVQLFFMRVVQSNNHKGIIFPILPYSGYGFPFFPNRYLYLHTARNKTTSSTPEINTCTCCKCPSEKNIKTKEI